MTEHPILFAGRLVRAILEGRKTQTRRLIRDRGLIAFFGCGEHHGDGVVWRFYKKGHSGPGWYLFSEDYPEEGAEIVRCPYGEPGHTLWVRETWRPVAGKANTAAYAADPPRGYLSCDTPGCPGEEECNCDLRWRPSIHMPRWASRITLEVTGIRVERLQAITEKDAKAEGIEPDGCDHGPFANPCPPPKYRAAFERAWDSINGKRGNWASNPWVWVVEFRRIESGARGGGGT